MKGGDMNRVTVTEAAEALGVSPQFVRIGMQRGLLPIGSCVKVSTKWTYCIPKERLEAYIKGKDLIDFAIKGGNR